MRDEIDFSTHLIEDPLGCDPLFEMSQNQPSNLERPGMYDSQENVYETNLLVWLSYWMC